MDRLLIILLHIFILAVSTRTWDLAVLVENKIELLNVTYTGKETGRKSLSFLNVTKSFAYNPVEESFFITSKLSEETASISSLTLQGDQRILVQEPHHWYVMSIAYDHISRTLYWTNGKQVLYMHPKERNSTRTVLHEFENEEPTGIAVDVCGRNLFWTNSKLRFGTIRRSNVDGSSAVVVVSNLYSPTGITVDQKLQRLYWCDDLEGVHYKIESSDLNGDARVTLVSGMHQSPISITVALGRVYWTEPSRKTISHVPSDAINLSRVDVIQGFDGIKAITTWEKDFSLDECKREIRVEVVSEEFGDEWTTTELMTSTKLWLPKSNLKLKMEDKSGVEHSTFSDDCLNGGRLLNISSRISRCSCPQGYSGQHCEVKLCSNFCLNGGQCGLDERGEPICRCEGDFQGLRCEIECSLYCQQGDLIMSVRGEMTSLCMCFNEANKASLVCGYITWNNPYFYGLIISCFTLAGLVVILVVKVYKLSRRPRIKKRIIVNKNVTPLTSRPPPPGDQCEITIENCCNMNICETPCYEPQLRSGKGSSKTEEKKNLLGNMEEGKSTPPCQENLY